MTAHHIITSDILKEKCAYCSSCLDISKWESDHVSGRHYKINICPCCKKEAKIEVDFDGDGTDSWAIPIDEHLKNRKNLKESISFSVKDYSLKEKNAPAQVLEKIISKEHA